MYSNFSIKYSISILQKLNEHVNIILNYILKYFNKQLGDAI